MTGSATSTPREGPLRHVGAGLTDVGRKRKHNEDAILIDRELGLYIVSDGLGGYAAGELASQMTVETVHRLVSAEREKLINYIKEPHSQTRVPVMNLLERAIDTACLEVHNAGRRDNEKRGMAATIALICMLGKYAIVAHVGDTRVYLARRGQVHQLTEDHSLLTEQIRLGVITAEQAASGKHKTGLTRTIGRNESEQVELLHFELMPGDAFLICSDGLADYLHQGQEFLERAGLPPSQAARELVDYANASGGHDNISVVIVKTDGEPEKDAFDAFTKMEVLRRLPLFQHLNFKELMCVLNIVEVKGCQPGDQIIQDGAEGDELFVTVVGAFDVLKGGNRIASMSAGDFFGEMALVSRAPRSADVVATQPSKVLVIRRDTFYMLLIERPVMATKLLWAFCQEFSDRLRSKGEPG